MTLVVCLSVCFVLQVKSSIEPLIHRHSNPNEENRMMIIPSKSTFSSHPQFNNVDEQTIGLSFKTIAKTAVSRVHYTAVVA